MLDTNFRRSIAREALVSPRLHLGSSILASPRYSRSAIPRESLRILDSERVLYSGTMSWESALADVLSVLRIQYRSEAGVETFLNDPERVAQLRTSPVARMEYNRRCMREEVDSGIYSPPRARRIAKDVAIDYIRRFLDSEEDRVEMVRKIHDVAKERDDAIATNFEVQGENAELRKDRDCLVAAKEELLDVKANIEENLSKTVNELKETEHTLESISEAKKQTDLELNHSNAQLESSRAENAQLREDLAALKRDYESSRQDNAELRNEYQAICNESAGRRDEISKLTQKLEKEQHARARAEAHSSSVEGKNKHLNAENQEFKEKNLSLRDKCNVYRAREHEMEALVKLQMGLLSPEKAKADLEGACRVPTKIVEPENTESE